MKTRISNRLGRLSLQSLAIMLVAFGIVASQPALASSKQTVSANDPRLEKAYRFQKDGWTYVHLEGSPSDIGFQHGYLLAPEIADALEVTKLLDTHDTQRDWEFFRKTAREMLWPHIDSEYQKELQGIADGAKAHGDDLDVYDIVAMNAAEEVPDYYVPWLNKREKQAKAPKLVGSGQLQRVHRHRRLHQRSPDRDCPQQLDQLPRRRTLGHRLRHRSATRPAHSDGWLSRSDYQRR